MSSQLKSCCTIVAVVAILGLTILYNGFQNQKNLPVQNYSESLKKLKDRYIFNSQPEPLFINDSELSTANTTNVTNTQIEHEKEREEEDCGNCRNLKPVVAIDPREWQLYPGSTWKGLKLPALTLEPMGRFGNIMGEYATLYALNRIYNVTVRVLPSMRNELKTAFPNLVIPLIPEGTEKNWKTLERVASGKYANFEAASAGLMGPHPFKGSGWPFQIQLFHAYCCQIRKEFTFSKEIQNDVQAFWERIFKERTINRTEITLIGIHVRRTDYVKKMSQYNSKVPEDSYFERAINYYKDKFPKILIVAASDDMSYIKKTFKKLKDVIYAPGKSKEVDMAILASCNHSIITVGSFGFWTGYLAGGEVVYPDIFISSVYPFSRSTYELSQLNFFTPMSVE